MLLAAAAAVDANDDNDDDVDDVARRVSLVWPASVVVCITVARQLCVIQSTVLWQCFAAAVCCWLVSDGRFPSPSRRRPARCCFYRATLCVARIMMSQDVRLSVCPSVHHTAVLCRKRLNVPLNFFHHRVATPFYFLNFFRTKSYGVTGASNAGGWEIRDFRPMSRFVSEMIQDRAIVTVKRE